MKTIFFSIISVILLVPSFVSASPIDLNYSGAVSSLTYAECLTYSSWGGCDSWSFSDISATDFIPGNLITVGDSFNGSFLYDPEAPLSAISDDGYQAVHLYSVPGADFSVGQLQLPDSYLTQTGFGSFSVVDGRYGYDSFFLQTFFSSADFFTIVNLHLQDSTGTVFTGFDVPTAFDLSDFNAIVFNVALLRYSDGNQIQLYGTLDSLSVATPVPEPTTALLIVVGVGAIILTRFFRRRDGCATSPRVYVTPEL